MSLRVTPVAVALELALFATVTVKVTVSPALGVLSLTVLVTDRSTLLTLVLALSVLLALLGRATSL